jgi:hypothetical protein
MIEAIDERFSWAGFIDILSRKYVRYELTIK